MIYSDDGRLRIAWGGSKHDQRMEFVAQHQIGSKGAPKLGEKVSNGLARSRVDALTHKDQQSTVANSS